MAKYLLVILAFIALAAIWLRADFALSAVYLLAGTLLVGSWWSQRALGSVEVRRTYSERMFYGEKSVIQLEVRNHGRLPIVWLQLRESVPVQVRVGGQFARVFNLGSRGRQLLEYAIEGRQRGYYELGPLDLRSGDLFGLAGEGHAIVEADFLTVYPKIIPLTGVDLLSHSPLGSLRHNQPLFEDPSRVRGKRDYISGDSERRIDWKASASTGWLQVKLLEPSISLETIIFLNLNSEEYDLHTRGYTSELAIIVAASLANWVIAKRQAAGLLVNGIDPELDARGASLIPARRGRGHLMRILDVLARIQMGATEPIDGVLAREIVNLPWGTTLVLITGRLDEAVFDSLFQARRQGLDVVLVPCGQVSGFNEARRRAEYFGFSFYPVLDERDLDMWRG
jgi:uncharacterized protein (DUF58 family)